MSTPMDDYETRRAAVEHDQAREIDHLRNVVAVDLAAMVASIRSATRAIRALAGDQVYDVEIAEGPGRFAPDVLDQMLVTLAGVRKVTVDAGR